MNFNLQYIGLALGLFPVLMLDKSFAQTYRAAVVAYKPERQAADLPDETLTRNKEKYHQLIEEVRGKADIIIFPEGGLTTIEPDTEVRDHIKPYSITVPDPQSIPCLVSDNAHVLVGLSCDARTYRIYVVCNVVEQSGKDKDIKYYSTNVVFDPEGRLILRCRKKYPDSGSNYDKGDPSERCVFEAKFKNKIVNFALLFDTDLVHATEENSLDHVILTSSIKNELPTAYGLSLQVGYSVSNKVNLLASGYADLSNAYGGSGIYLKNGTSKVALNSEVIIGDIPINEKVLEEINVDVKPSSTLPDPAFIYSLNFKSIPILDEVNTTVDHLFNDNNNNYCKFKKNGNDIRPYRWVAFSSSVQYLDQEIPHLVVCALIKPEGEMKNHSISQLTISTKFDSDNVIQLLPISLQPNMLPANFKYVDKKDGSSRTATMSLTKEGGLLSFGIVVVLKDAVPSSSSSIHTFYIYTVGFLPVFLVLWSKEFIFSL